jgi:hypothetical protein
VESWCATSTAVAGEPVKTCVVDVANVGGPCRGPERGAFEAFSDPSRSQELGGCRPPGFQPLTADLWGSSVVPLSASALLRNRRQVLPNNRGSFWTIGNSEIDEDALHGCREELSLDFRDLHKTLLQAGSQCGGRILHQAIHCFMPNANPYVELSLQSTSFLHGSSWFLGAPRFA